MNNFFSNNVDYNLFKKALRSTSNEPVVINIMSNDSSLAKPEDEDVKVNVERKNMSAKYQASPFGKFFGPRKQRTDPIDMKDFSSWKNKNYRQSEQQVTEEIEEKPAFSFSDYLKSRTRDSMYNDEDKLKSELQKPIDQMSIYDEKYNRFSLDSYLNKLEQQSKVDKDFKETEDLMDPFENSQEVVPTSEQDENFSYSAGVDIEKVAFDEVTTGDKFSFEREELDKVRTRLDKLEREANNIKEKQTEKVISSNELSDIANGDEEEDGFDLDKLGFESDDIEKVNATMAEKSKDKDEETSAPKKTFFEINRTGDSKAPFAAQRKEQEEKAQKVADESEDLSKFFEEESENDISENTEETVGSEDVDVKEEKEETSTEEKTVEEPVDDNLAAVEAEPDVNETSENVDESAEAIQESELKTDVGGEVLTKAEFKSITDEIISKFSDMYKTEKEPGEVPTETGIDEIPMQTGEIPAGVDANTMPGYNATQPYDGSYATQQPNGYMQEYPQQMGHNNILQQQTELQARMLELIEQNKKSDSEVAEKLRLAELEKQKVAEEYENRLKELERTIRQREEDAKQKAYIEKLKSDIKLKKAETDYKVREARMKESAKHHSNIRFVGAQLKAELKNSINVSNLEMEKLLLECVTKINKEAQKEKERQLEEAQAKLEAETSVDESESQEVEEVVDEPKAKTTRARTTRGRTTTRRTTRRTTTRTHSHTRTPRRKIDSDIIGGINFD